KFVLSICPIPWGSGELTASDVKGGKFIRSVQKKRNIGRTTGFCGTAEVKKVFSEEVEEELADHTGFRTIGIFPYNNLTSPGPAHAFGSPSDPNHAGHLHSPPKKQLPRKPTNVKHVKTRVLTDAPEKQVTERVHEEMKNKSKGKKNHPNVRTMEEETNMDKFWSGEQL
uniref:Uncharacterized protein n=1 Tax=Oryzias melastigma TaxID=30732 RepID=A0A3B3D4X9_ORYME